MNLFASAERAAQGHHRQYCQCRHTQLQKKSVEFEEALRRIVENGTTRELDMHRTHPKHLPAKDLNSSVVPYRIVENNETTMNNNGNNVDIDAEMANLSENQLMYNYMVDRVSGHYNKMKTFCRA